MTTLRSDARRTTSARYRLTLLALASATFGLGLAEFTVMGLMPEIGAGIGGSDETVGVGITTYAIGVVIGAPVLTVLASRMRRKNFALLLVLLFVLGNVLTVFAVDPVSFSLARLLAGLPHGALFGVAAVIAKEVAPRGHTGRAIAAVGLGLMVANLVGVPAATWLGQVTDWRITFAVIAAVGVLTVIAIVLAVPRVADEPSSSATQELRGLLRPWLWVGVVIAGLGLSAQFAVYSYISPIVANTAGTPGELIPFVQASFGLGMTLGALAGGRLADWSVPKAMGIALVSIVVASAIYAGIINAPFAAFVGPFLIAFVCQLMGPAIQIALMNSSPKAPTLAASLYHSAFNIANAIGALTGGYFVARGWYAETPWIGAAYALIALAIACTGWIVLGRQHRRHEILSH